MKNNKGEERGAYKLSFLEKGGLLIEKELKRGFTVHEIE